MRMIAIFRAKGYRALKMEVPTVADGADYLRGKIASSGLGASDVGRCTIEAEDGRVWRVSYNGRVWDSEGNEIQLRKEGGQ